jgi:7TM diverse intracellular signalling/7TMR-DISM extracellular 2
MKKTAFVCFLICLFFSKSHAKDLPTLALYVSRDSQQISLNWKDWLYQNAEIFVDSTGKLDFKTIQTQPFIALPKQYVTRFLYMDNPHNRYWIRFKIKNIHPSDTLNLDFVAIHPYVTVYDVKHNNVSETNINTFFPTKSLKERLPYRFNYPFYTAPSDSTTLYVRFGERATESFAWNINLSTASEVQKGHLEKSYNLMPKLIFNFFFLGTLLMMLSVALFFFMFTRQSAYFFYIIYLLSLLLTFLRGFENALSFPIFYSYFPISYGLSEGVWAVAVQVSYSYFLIKILELKTSHPHTYRILRGTIFFSWGYLVVDILCEIFFFNEDFALGPYIAYRLICALLGIYTLWSLRKDKRRVTRLIVYGSLCLLIGVLLSMPFSTYQANKILVDHLMLMKIGIFFEMIFFTMALAYRNQEIERERRQKLEENNALLLQLSDQAELKRQAAEAELKHTRARCVHTFYSTSSTPQRTKFCWANPTKQRLNYLIWRASCA